MADTKRIAVVTGANRGIGYEICRQLVAKGLLVVLTARDEKKGKAAADDLNAEFHVLDVTDPRSIAKLRDDLKEAHGRVDVLVNNAGIFLDGDNEGGTSAFKAEIDTIRETLETNVYGPFQLCQALIPLMKGYGRIVNLSSGMGQLAEMNGGYPAYRISKTAINALTRIFADETEGKGILVNSMCPGWVKTDMGGVGADRSVEQGADTAVWLATLPEGGPTGGFFRDREPIAW